MKTSEIKTLFVTAALGDKYVKRCLLSLNAFNKLDYDKNDKVIVVTDDVEAFKNVTLHTDFEVVPYYLPDKWPVVNKDNFRTNTIVKLLLFADSVKKDKDHNLSIWFDCDAFPIVKKEKLQDYNNYDGGFYYKDSHILDNEDEVLCHHLWSRGIRYYNNLDFVYSVTKSPENKIAKNENNKFCFPIETTFFLKRDIDNLNYKAKENKFYVLTHDIVRYCLHNHLDDTYGESFELGIIIGNSFGICKQAPVIPMYCDMHIIPKHNAEEDLEHIKQNNTQMYENYLS